MKKVNIDRKANKAIRHRRFLRKLAINHNYTPRLIVTKTNANIFAQIVDDQNHKVLASANTLQIKKHANIESAKIIGEKVAEKALALGISQVVFDRTGNKFHGVIKSVADGAKEKGLKI